MEYDLLVLHPEAKFGDVWYVFESLRAAKILQAREKINQGMTGGVIVLANDEMIEKYRHELTEKGITFFPNWKTDKKYRDMIRYGLKNGVPYVMSMMDTPNGKDWWFKEASEEDIEIKDLEGMVNVVPKL